MALGYGGQPCVWSDETFSSGNKCEVSTVGDDAEKNECAPRSAKSFSHHIDTEQILSRILWNFKTRSILCFMKLFSLLTVGIPTVRFG